MTKKYFTLIIIFFTILALVPLVLYFYQFNGKLSNSQSNWGAFGEYFAGTFGTVISLLALIGLIFSIEMTKRQFRRQSEESTFFNLLNLHINKVNNLVLDETHKGYNSFEQYRHLFEAEVRKHLINDARFRYVKQPDAISNRAATLFGRYMNSQFPTIAAFHNFSTQHCTTEEEKIVFQYLLDKKEEDRDEIIKESFGFPFPKEVAEELYNIGLGYYMDYSLKEKAEFLHNTFEHFYDDYGQFFGHYFRNMHHILRYVKTTETAKDYIKIYRAQLSRFELAALFYNYMGSNVGTEFISNIYEMKMFKGIYTSDLFFTPTQDEFEQIIKYRYDNAKKTK